MTGAGPLDTHQIDDLTAEVARLRSMLLAGGACALCIAGSCPQFEMPSAYLDEGEWAEIFHEGMAMRGGA